MSSCDNLIGSLIGFVEHRRYDQIETPVVIRLVRCKRGSGRHAFSYEVRIAGVDTSSGGKRRGVTGSEIQFDQRFRNGFLA